MSVALAVTVKVSVPAAAGWPTSVLPRRVKPSSVATAAEPSDGVNSGDVTWKA